MRLTGHAPRLPVFVGAQDRVANRPANATVLLDDVEVLRYQARRRP